MTTKSRSARRIAGYVVEETLGEGRRSVIYGARGPSGERVALKQVRTKHREDRRGIGYAGREHEIGTTVTHPTIRRSHRLLRQRELFRIVSVTLVLEYVDGQPISQKRPHRLDVLCRLFEQWAAGLAALHDAGYVHTDVKPHNLLWPESDAVPKLIDFEHAWPVGRAKSYPQGTAEYAAPEQMALEALHPSADVFSLGVSLYWAATGELPPNPGQREQVGGRTRRLEPPERYRPDMPPVLSTLILGCLQPAPLDRPESMHAVRSRLDLARRYLEGA